MDRSIEQPAKFRTSISIPYDLHVRVVARARELGLSVSGYLCLLSTLEVRAQVLSPVKVA